MVKSESDNQLVDLNAVGEGTMCRINARV
jgi:hypothetical protein